jgi:hypothetical protein
MDITKPVDSLLKWHVWFIILVVAVVLIMTGCVAAIRGFPEEPRTSTAAPPDPDYLLGKQALEIYNRETDTDKKKVLRNEIIDARMEEIDKKFGDFERELYKQGVGFGIGTDWIVLALTATTTVVGGEATKSALGAASTGVVGAKASFEKSALFDKALPALIAGMVAQRETLRASIRTSEGLSVDRYSIYAALSDLQRFKFAGSIPGSLQALAEDAGQKAGVARKKLRELGEPGYVETETRKLLLKFLQSDDKNANKKNEKALWNWMRKNGFSTAPGQISMFIHSDVLENARDKAVRDLGLNKK